MPGFKRSKKNNGAAASSGDIRLVVSNEPVRTEHLFQNDYREFLLCIVDPDGGMVKPTTDMGVAVTVLAKRAGEPDTEAVIDNEVKVDVISKSNNNSFRKGNPRLTMQLRLTTLSGQRRFALRFTVLSSGHEIEAITSFFHVVAHRLVILKQPEVKWYKDASGAKSIKFEVNVQDRDHHRPNGYSEVGLKYALLYEQQDGDTNLDVMVPGQAEVMKLSPKCSSTYNYEEAATVAFKMTQISRNHRKKRFVMRVSIDTTGLEDDPDNFAHHVGAAYCNPIQVLSKKPGTKKKQQEGKKRKAPDTHNYAPLERHPQHFKDGVDMKHPPSKLRKSDIFTLNASGGEEATALAEVVSWCQLARTTLSAMEWQHVGFECTQDGNMNLHAPLYRCHSCWSYKDNLRTPVHLPGCALNKALQTYSSFVDKKAAVLVRYGLNRADDTASGRNQAASSSNNGGGSNGGGSNNNNNNNNNDTAADWSHEPTIIPSNLEGMPEVSANRIYRTHSTEQRVNNGSVHVDLGSGAIAVHALPSITALGQSSQGIQGIVSPNQRISSATAYGFGSINRLTDNPYDLGSSNAMPSMTPVLLTRHPSDLVLPQDSHWQENSVAYIWVQATAKGFPCFDREGNWIGSYQYWNVDPSTASLQFAEVGTAVDTNEKTQMESRFKSAKDLKAPEVFENAHDIESTKEKALLFHIKMNLPVLNGILK